MTSLFFFGPEMKWDRLLLTNQITKKQEEVVFFRSSALLLLFYCVLHLPPLSLPQHIRKVYKRRKFFKQHHIIMLLRKLCLHGLCSVQEEKEEAEEAEEAKERSQEERNNDDDDNDGRGSGECEYIDSFFFLHIELEKKQTIDTKQIKIGRPMDRRSGYTTWHKSRSNGPTDRPTDRRTNGHTQGRIPGISRGGWGRGAIFPAFEKKSGDGPTDRPTDRQIDRPTDRRTHLLIESLSRDLKRLFHFIVSYQF